MDTRRSHITILKEVTPECSLEGLMLKLKPQCSGHLMPRADSWKKTLMLGKMEGRRIRGRRKMGWLDSITDSMDVTVSKLRAIVEDGGSLAGCSPGGHKEWDPT